MVSLSPLKKFVKWTCIYKFGILVFGLYVFYLILVHHLKGSSKSEISYKSLKFSRCSDALKSYISEMESGLHVMKNERIQKILDLMKNNYDTVHPGQMTCVEYCNRFLPENYTEHFKALVGEELHINSTGDYNLDSLTTMFNFTDEGGAWAPMHEGKCEGNKSPGVAIIIPMRDRWKQLATTLSALHPLLWYQKLCYRIFVVEQTKGEKFNKGKLMNAGFVEAWKRFHFGCVIFHDADVYPINVRIPYACDAALQNGPVHISSAMDIHDYKLLYPTLTGGALKMTPLHFTLLNGFSTMYWVWGGEDDDMYKRIKLRGLKLTHENPKAARFNSVPHDVLDKRTKNYRFNAMILRRTKFLADYDGLRTLDYQVVDVKLHKLFTHLVVDVGKPWDCLEHDYPW